MTVQMSLGQVIAIIILAIVLVLLVPVLSALTESATAQSLRTKCTLSIEAKLAGEGATFGLASPFDINCDRRIVQFDQEQAVIFNHENFEKVSRTTPYTYDVATQREDSVVPTPRTLTADSDNLTKDLLDAFAYEATECWEMFMNGRADILNSESTLGSTKSCVICTEISLNAPGIDETVDIGEYFETTRHYVSTEPAGQFSDILYTDQPPSYSRECAYGHEGSWGPDQTRLETGNTYAVVFYRWGSDVDWLTNQQCQAVTVAPVSEIPKNCVAVLN